MIDVMEECYSVTQANTLARQVLEEYSLWIQGEVSNTSADKYYYKYFSLKDESASISCVFPVAKLSSLDFVIQDGMSLKVFGKLSVFERDGRFQFKAEIIQQAGEGDLQAKIEEIKRKLQQEGLFDESRKKKLPLIPKRIAVITSKDGAAWKDFFKILNERYPNLEVLLYDVLVQGSKAAGQVIKALEYINTLEEIDLIVITRGGGSLEDLMAFNDESLARAIAASHYPVVSAIGHEKDVSISDLVADQRASTPSNAAELISPDKESLYQGLDTIYARLYRWGTQRVDLATMQLHGVIERSVLEDRYRLIRRFSESLDTYAAKIFAHRRLLTTYDGIVDQYQYKMLQMMQVRIRALDNRLDSISQDLQETTNRLLSSYTHSLETYAVKLQLGNPLQILEKGYSILKDESGKVIKSVSNVQKGQVILADVADGSIQSTILSTTKHERT
jgi:exodeoxyribonuclease VII large subunit